MGMSDTVRQRLADVPRKRTNFDPNLFARRGTVNQNVTGERSRIFRLRADTVHAFRGGEANPMPVAVPAYESFTTNGDAGDTETFDLAYDIVQSPMVADAAVYLDGTRYGQPDAIDYDANTIDVTDPNTGSTVHVWYITKESATLQIEKALPSKGNGTNSSVGVYEENLSLLHVTDQAEQTEYLEFDSELGRFVATDMTVDVYLRAPYTFQYTAEGGDAVAENLLLGIPGVVGRETVQGLKSEVATNMADKQS